MQGSRQTLGVKLKLDGACQTTRLENTFISFSHPAGEIVTKPKRVVEINTIYIFVGFWP